MPPDSMQMGIGNVYIYLAGTLPEAVNGRWKCESLSTAVKLMSVPPNHPPKHPKFLRKLSHYGYNPPPAITNLRNHQGGSHQ